MNHFIIYPAIDLRRGKVVRLRQGDPAQITTYSDDPAETARMWAAEGAQWIHVVNLDGAFGEGDSANQKGLEAILQVATSARIKVQFGGGVRSMDDVNTLLSLGVQRIILGTAAVENAALVQEAIQQWGAERIGVGIDARDGKVRVRGWMQESSIDPVALGKSLAGAGLRTVVFTNIARDGVSSGPDVESTKDLAQQTGLDVIASGGVASPGDVEKVKNAGLSGIIIGRALYEGQLTLKEVL